MGAGLSFGKYCYRIDSGDRAQSVDQLIRTVQEVSGRWGSNSSYTRRDWRLDSGDGVYPINDKGECYLLLGFCNDYLLTY